MIKISVRKRRRRREKANGRAIIQVRYVLDYIDPVSKRRRQLFFATQELAISAREKILLELASGTGRQDLTVAEAFAHWTETKSQLVRPPTLSGYRKIERYIVGPLAIGTAQERRAFAMGRRAAQEVELRDMLGQRRVCDLMTWEVRRWHQELCELVSPHTARLAKGVLHAVLKLAAEDFGVRTPVMPSGLGRIRDKNKKRILTLEQGRVLIEAARRDPTRGIHVAFPFLTGMRPSEQLGLTWDDVDLEARSIDVRRAREVRGGIVNETKTPAGVRRVPICDTLRDMLVIWRGHWGEDGGNAYVFRCAGGSRHEPGRAMIYSNFLRTYWRPFLSDLGLPVVPPHSGRHWFISTLQALGVEVGLVARIVGHRNPAITLAHYTQAVRPEMQGVVALDTLCAQNAARPEQPVSPL